MTIDRQKARNVCAAKNSAANCAFRLLLLVLVIFGMPSKPGFGQATTEQSTVAHQDVPFGDLIHRHYDADDGLPSTWIHDLLQTRDGYLWVGTHNGVARFDGMNFTTFDRGNTPQLPANDTRELYESRDGTLWIGSTGGLAQYRGGQPGSFELIEELKRNSIQAVFEDRSGAIWVGTRERTWRAKPGLRFEIVDEAPTHVWAFFQDQTGTIWLGSEFGLYKQNEDGFNRTAQEALPSAKDPNKAVRKSLVTELAEDSDGNLLIGTFQGLLVHKDGRFEYCRDGLPANRVLKIRPTRNGEALITAGALFRWKDGTCERLVNGPTQCVSVDREGGIWVGHGHNGGLHYYRDNATSQLPGIRRVFCVHEDQEGSVWFGSQSGLHRLRDGQIASFGKADGLPSARISSINRASDDGLWIGTAKGLAKWSDGSATKITHPTPLAELNITGVCEDSAGALWLALMGEETQVLKDGVLNTVEELSHGKTRWFYNDARGNLWIGHEYGLFRADKDGVKQVNPPEFAKLNTSHFTCHCVDADGTLWLGNSGGIVRFQSGRFDVFTSNDGLAAEYVQHLQADNCGYLWVGGRHGFYTVAIDQFDGIVSGRLDRVRCKQIEKDYGVSGSTGLRSAPRSCLARDGNTWIATGNGLMNVRPNPLPSTLIPPDVHIDRVQVEGRTADADQPIEYLSGEKRVVFEFSAPNFSNPQWVQVKYKLEGHHEEWIDALDQRSVSYTDLRPGDFTFRVKADNGHGVWSEEDAVVGFTVNPRWWEIVWLRAAVLLTVFVTTLAYFRYRLKKVYSAYNLLQREISERERAEEDSRQHLDQLARVSRAASMGELSSSIAHEIKQPLFAIVSNAQTARRLLDRDPLDMQEIREALTDIADDGNRASDIIDHIRMLVKKEHQPSDNLNLNEIARSVVDLSLGEIHNRGISIETDFESNLPLVKGDPIELQQVILNLIINGAQAMNHKGSKTGELKIETTLNNGSIELAVKDSGVGLGETEINRMFDPFYTTKQDGTGMGLAINRTIIEAHGGRIWATDNEDSGATFHFSLPINENSGK